MASLNSLVDPLAQSFFIEEPCCVTKVDLYFKTKDTYLPMLTQIRANDNGFPGDYIVPFSEKITYPRNISTSTDASTPTTIIFDAPIYLVPGEYSLCLGTDSKKYQVYISELDQDDLVTGKRISSQPYMGTLYKSQNATTWTPEQTQDLKFNLYRAIFDKNVTATLDFKARQLGAMNSKVLQDEPLEVFNGSTLMRVHHRYHGMTNGTYVVISSIANLDGYVSGAVASANNGVTPGTALGQGISGPGTGFGINFDNVAGVALQISNVTTNSYTVDVGTAATASARFGGNQVVVTKNLLIDAVQPKLGLIQNGDTNVVHQLKGTLTNYTQDSTFFDIQPTLTELNQTRLVANPTVKANNLSGNESFHYRMNLSTQNKYVSPLIDKQQIGLLTYHNLINNPTYASEHPLTEDEVTLMSAINTTFTATDVTPQNEKGVLTVPLAHQENALAIPIGSTITLTGVVTDVDGTYRVTDIASDGSEITLSAINLADPASFASTTTDFTIVYGKTYIVEEANVNGSVISKYITRKITLANPSTALNLRVDVNRKAGSNILFYYKPYLIGEDAETAEFIEIAAPNLPVSLDNAFTEIELELDELTPFDGLEIKIAFTSSNSAIVPKCKNLRVIALA